MVQEQVFLKEGGGAGTFAILFFQGLYVVFTFGNYFTPSKIVLCI